MRHHDDGGVQKQIRLTVVYDGISGGEGVDWAAMLHGHVAVGSLIKLRQHPTRDLAVHVSHVNFRPHFTRSGKANFSPVRGARCSRRIGIPERCRTREYLRNIGILEMVVPMVKFHLTVPEMGVSLSRL